MIGVVCVQDGGGGAATFLIDVEPIRHELRVLCTQHGFRICDRPAANKTTPFTSKLFLPGWDMTIVRGDLYILAQEEGDDVDPKALKALLKGPSKPKQAQKQKKRVEEEQEEVEDEEAKHEEDEEIQEDEEDDDDDEEEDEDEEDTGLVDAGGEEIVQAVEEDEDGDQVEVP